MFGHPTFLPIKGCLHIPPPPSFGHCSSSFLSFYVPPLYLWTTAHWCFQLHCFSDQFEGNEPSTVVPISPPLSLWLSFCLLCDFEPRSPSEAEAHQPHCPLLWLLVSFFSSVVLSTRFCSPLPVVSVLIHSSRWAPPPLSLAKWSTTPFLPSFSPFFSVFFCSQCDST